MIGRSNYHEHKKEEFYFEITGETIENGEECYVCVLLPQYQKEMQSGDKPFTLRKCLFKEGGIYVFEKEHIEQLSLL